MWVCLQSTALRADVRRTLRVGLPLVGAQLLQMGNGLVDAVMAGRIGSAELAAGGIGGSLWFVVSLSCIGLMAGLSPTLSTLIGQKRRAFVGTIFRQGLWLGLVTGLVALGVLLLVARAVHSFPLASELPPLIQSYLYGACWSLPFFALTMAARNVCEATGLTRSVLLVTALGLVINIIGNLGLGLGWFGLPRLELLGIGLSTTLVNIGMMVSMLVVLTRKHFARYELFRRLDFPQWQYLKSMLVLSVPIFLGMLFEAGLFVATALQMGTIGVVESGAHQIAISASAFCYMLPLGISFALTARVGRAAALGSLPSLYLRIASGVLLLVVMAVCTALTLVIFRFEIAALYTQDEQLQQFAASLLLLGALFQLSDGAQIVLIGILRGLHDTRVPMLINAFSYWVIAFGFGVYCAHGLGWGAHGLWVGLVTGLSVASLLLCFRLRQKLRVNRVERSISGG
jgi:multidrug resistance protein, MATE family